MPGRVIAAALLMIGCAFSALADGPGTMAVATAAATAAVAVPPKTWDGSVCEHDGDCRSHHCGVSWDGSHYCTRADLSCAFPATAGVRPGFAKSTYGETYTCQSGGDWMSEALRTASRKPAAPAKHPSSTATAALAAPAKHPASATPAALTPPTRRPERETASTAPANYPPSPLLATQTAALPPTPPFSQPTSFQSGWHIRFW